MQQFKCNATQTKREETIDKVLKLIENSFEGIDITVKFAKRILEDAIRVLEDRSGEVTLRELNKNVSNKF